ncbi:phosphonate ABC transporter ATP-binding protein [Paludifilum halophilum]|uniref:Phosphonate ABC transporter ATP-binding protein n=1 Tax=Paludifilum halophilum TaxID=1642702 RepID=A0A235B9Y7_9BACL|nr:phosphonate ABC transporter ATP-binding protein [Paludifilum halophilum]OYD09042.1 phosphonate ABC transporter ATP-binding protein [Paludifilum halophilum]
MLKWDQVSKIYQRGAAPALQEVTLSVRDGEFVVVLGRSGAGKSTLIRCANHLVRPTSGEVYWNGHNVTAASGGELLRIRSEMGMIFQHFNLISRLDVLTNVMVGRFYEFPLWRSLTGIFPPEAEKKGKQALERVGIGHLARRRADGLSGGQQQRVAVARVLMQRPKLLLGDEPVASLDPVTSRSILDLLKGIHDQEGMTTVMNLHDVELARRVATRVIGMSAGSMVFDGRPEELDEKAVERIYRMEE